MAVLVSHDLSLTHCHVSGRQHVPVFDVWTPAIELMRAAIANNDWSDVYVLMMCQKCMGCFYNIAKLLLHRACENGQLRAT
jgi:hypothetical protein